MTSPYLRAAARLRAQAALKLEQRLGEEVADIEVVDVVIVYLITVKNKQKN